MLRSIGRILDKDAKELRSLWEQYTSTSATRDQPVSIQLKKMNLLALTGVLLPLMNLLLPFAIFFASKRLRQNRVLRKKGSKIIAFQLIWSVLAIFLLVSTGIAQQFLLSVSFESTLGYTAIAYYLFFLGNVCIVMVNALKLEVGNMDIYSFLPPILF